MRWNPETRTLTISMPRLGYWITGRRRKLSFALALFFLINALMAWVDLPLSEFMRQLEPDIIAFFRAITKAGDSKYILIPLALILPFLLATRYALEASPVRRMISWGIGALLFVFTAVAASGILVNILKVIFGRTRPRMWVDNGEYGFAPFTLGESLYQSFPSGHSVTAFAIAAAFICLFPRLRYVMLVLAGTVAFSRVVITAHYLSDVIAGSLLGYYFTFWLRRQFARRGWVFIRRNGSYRIQASGQLLAYRLRRWLAEKLGVGLASLQDPHRKLP